jgi:hypothetical protein
MKTHAPSPALTSNPDGKPYPSRTASRNVRRVACAGVLCVLGCSPRGPNHAGAQPGNAQSGPAGTTASATPSYKDKKLTPSECEKFAEHTFAVVKKEFKKAAQDCPKTMKDAMMNALDKGMAKEQDKLVESCKDDSKAGKTIKVKDYNCFMAARRFDDWTDCKFEQDEFVDAEIKMREAIKKLKEACKKAAQGAEDDE